MADYIKKDGRHFPVNAGLDDEGNIINIGADETSKSLNVNQRVWSPDLMAWVRMTQPTLEGDVTVGIVDFKDCRVEYNNDGLVKYFGGHEVMDADTSDVEWAITLYEYDSRDKIVRVRTQETSWDNRAEGWN